MYTLGHVENLKQWVLVKKSLKKKLISSNISYQYLNLLLSIVLTPAYLFPGEADRSLGLCQFICLLIVNKLLHTSRPQLPHLENKWVELAQLVQMVMFRAMFPECGIKLRKMPFTIPST